MYCLLTSLLLLQVQYVDLDSDDDFVSVPKKWRKTNSSSSGPSTLTQCIIRKVMHSLMRHMNDYGPPNRAFPLIPRTMASLKLS